MDYLARKAGYKSTADQNKDDLLNIRMNLILVQEDNKDSPEGVRMTENNKMRYGNV